MLFKRPWDGNQSKHNCRKYHLLVTVVVVGKHSQQGYRKYHLLVTVTADLKIQCFSAMNEILYCGCTTCLAHHMLGSSQNHHETTMLLLFLCPYSVLVVHIRVSTVVQVFVSKLNLALVSNTGCAGQ